MMTMFPMLTPSAPRAFPAPDKPHPGGEDKAADAPSSPRGGDGFAGIGGGRQRHSRGAPQAGARIF
jgi:hypothetical protein